MVIQDRELSKLRCGQRASGPNLMFEVGANLFGFPDCFADADHSFNQNLGAQAAAMNQPGQDFFMR